MLHQFNSVSSA